ncbi:CBS domain-containing protein [Parahaliea mediterranea]|uniref:CBS domain-containing protein n=1 Tax=Parahaliea mediterranea TaxID=651086 RepID=A0A939DFX6_9GAMM|nr:CBS domain-containing protein [Parahaliea mediterranea]MBN7796807.1 CBS domain-containing protein [Parahaliea mediterranea]
MKTLDLKPIDAADHLVHPEEFSDIGWSSPALEVFTDFRYHQPQVVDYGMPAMEAESLMRKAHVKLMLVVDRLGEFVGTISALDLSERQIVLHTARGRVQRQEVRVCDLMRDRETILGLEFDRLATASIRDVVETLKQNGEQHCLVVDSASHHIRGLISSSDIARRMHIPIEISRPNTFMDIFQAIRH